jgi:hypothetical protein
MTDRLCQADMKEKVQQTLFVDRGPGGTAEHRAD